MARSPSLGPTPAELEILRVLWSSGASTCRDIHEALPRRDQVGYTTVLKFLQIMVSKQLVTRRAGPGRSHRYEASATAADTQRGLLRDLMDRAFGGSSAELVLQALSAKPATAEELREIRKVLERAKKGTAR